MIRLYRVHADPFAWLILTIAAFSVSTLSYSLWPVPLNRALGFLIFLELGALYLVSLRRRDLPVLLLCLFVCGLSFAFCTDHGRNLTDAVYFAVTVLLLWKLADRKTAQALFRAMERLRGVILACVLCGDLLLIAGFCFPTSYTYLWGATGYYQGFTNSTHTLCAGVCLLLALTLFLLKDAPFRIWNALWLVPGLAAIAKSGARTYLVPAAVFAMLFLLCETPRTKLRLALLPVLLLGTAYFALFSGIAEKFSFLGGGALSRLTSGRTEFWRIDLNAYLEFDLLHLLFGRGFDYVYALNGRLYGVQIWAHADVLDLLLSTGVVGTAFYGFVIFAVLWTIAKRTRGVLQPLLLAVYVLFVLLVNGFFGYQHYVYSFAVLALTFMGAKEGEA